MRRLAGILGVLASAAWADIPPSDSIGCRDKLAAAACKRDDGTAGSCVKSTCSRNDYSNGPPPTSVEYECLKCGAAAIAPPPAEKKASCAALPAETAMGLLALALLRRRPR